MALSARDRFCRLVIGGLSLTFAANLIINLCMVVGLLPVVGMPLPFISKGGSSLLSLFIAFGIIVSMGTHKKFLTSMKYLFILFLFFSNAILANYSKHPEAKDVIRILVSEHGFR